MLNLEKLIHKSTLSLSAGQLQLITIASALITNAKVLILDEPLARLDPINATLICNVLRKIANNDKLVLVFEHHLDFLLKISDLVVFMDSGRIVAKGKPHEILPLLSDVDVPEISEAFTELYREKIVDFIPMDVEEALKAILNARKS